MKHQTSRRFHMGTVCIAASLLLSLSHVGIGAEEPLYLVRDGKPCTIIRGQDDDFAAERLERHLAEACGATIDVVVADQWQGDAKGSCVFVGSVKSNRWIEMLAAENKISLDPVQLTDQGYVAKRLSWRGNDCILLAGGGRDGAIYAVTDLIHWNLETDGRSAWVASLDTREIPRFRYRWFWVWDSRWDWGAPGKASTAVGGPYLKPAASFLDDGKRCIDFMADHKLNGLILWGFLRDSHGGVEAGQELCRYANHRGVRILPGVGTNCAYGGYYYEGKHPFNMKTWLGEHPELRALDKDGKPHEERDKDGHVLESACPSNPVHLQWLDRGAKWLFENFEIGGVNLEMGDFFTCSCPRCQQARAAIASNEPDYYKDMAISHRVTLATMRRLAPSAWLSYATYTGYTAEMQKTPPQFLSLIPDDVICQWTLTPEIAPTEQWRGVPGPAKHNLGYLHWCHNRWGRCADRFFLEEVRDMCRDAAGAGFEGLDTYGELSPERANVEIFYLAWEAFLWQPDMTVEEFVDQRLGRLYGGAKAARSLIEIIALVQGNDSPAAENVAKAIQLAESAREAASPEGRARWNRVIVALKRQ